jgi:NADPH:quinone reductase-like Zn-dependent oxidoreductase
MKAIGFAHYGSADQIELREVPRPEPEPDELLIRVHASSINSWDWEFLSGKPFINRLLFGLFKPRASKQILGADIAGVVEAVGSRVTRFRPGELVFGDLWDSWGGFAEYACAKEAGFELMPERATFEDAAAIPQAGVLAFQAIKKSGGLLPGQKVLINGAGGGVGTFAIQLAKLDGAEVTGVDRSHKLETIKALGADHVLDYEATNFTETGDRYDLIVDCQNFRSMLDNRRALRPGGTYAMVGGSIPRVYQLWLLALLEPFTRDDRRLRLVASGPNKGLSELKALLESGKLKPVIDRTWPLEETAEAMRYFADGRHTGKVVITV